MIAWAKDQNPKDFPNPYKMKIELNEDWYDENCNLCKCYGDLKKCTKCPLGVKYGECGSGYTSLWRLVAKTLTWEDWLINAKKFLKQIESLRRL